MLLHIDTIHVELCQRDELKVYVGFFYCARSSWIDYNEEKKKRTENEG